MTGASGPRPPVEGKIVRGGTVSWDCPCRGETLLFRCDDVAELPGHAECRRCHRVYEIRDDANVVYQVPDGVARGRFVSVVAAAPPVPTREKRLAFSVSTGGLTEWLDDASPFAAVIATMSEVDYADVRQHWQVSTLGGELWPLDRDDDRVRIEAVLKRMAAKIDEKVYEETRLARHVEQVVAAIRLVRERGILEAAHAWVEERIERGGAA